MVKEQQTTRFGIIYRALCLVTNKVYIGLSTCSLGMVIERHTGKLFEKDKNGKFKRKVKFSHALRKYPNESDWRWEVLYDSVPENLLNPIEKWMICVYDSCRNGYNSTFGGEGGLKFDETKKNMSESRKKLYHEGNLFVWNKGLTKNTDERLALIGQKVSATSIKNGSHKGEKHHFFGKKRPDTSKMNSLRIGDKHPNFGKKPWNYGISFKKRRLTWVIVSNIINCEEYRLHGTNEVIEFCNSINISVGSLLKYGKTKNFVLTKWQRSL